MEMDDSAESSLTSTSGRGSFQEIARWYSYDSGDCCNENGKYVDYDTVCSYRPDTVVYVAAGLTFYAGNNNKEGEPRTLP